MEVQFHSLPLDGALVIGVIEPVLETMQPPSQLAQRRIEAGRSAEERMEHGGGLRTGTSALPHH